MAAEVAVLLRVKVLKRGNIRAVNSVQCALVKIEKKGWKSPPAVWDHEGREEPTMGERKSGVWLHQLRGSRGESRLNRSN